MRRGRELHHDGFQPLRSSSEAQVVAGCGPGHAQRIHLAIGQAQAPLVDDHKSATARLCASGPFAGGPGRPPQQPGRQACGVRGDQHLRLRLRECSDARQVHGERRRAMYLPLGNAQLQVLALLRQVPRARVAHCAQRQIGQALVARDQRAVAGVGRGVVHRQMRHRVRSEAAAAAHEDLELVLLVKVRGQRPVGGLLHQEGLGPRRRRLVVGQDQVGDLAHELRFLNLACAGAGAF